MIQLRYFQWKYFLNNFSLLDDFLRLVCSLTVRSNFIMIYRQMLASYIFWWHMFFRNSFHIASQKAPINCFFWTSFLFLQSFLHISSISFCCDSWIICHLLHNLFLCFLRPFLVLFWMLRMLVTVNNPCHVSHASRITTLGTFFLRKYLLLGSRNELFLGHTPLW